MIKILWHSILVANLHWCRQTRKGTEPYSTCNAQNTDHKATELLSTHNQLIYLYNATPLGISFIHPKKLYALYFNHFLSFWPFNSYKGLLDIINFISSNLFFRSLFLDGTTLRLYREYNSTYIFKFISGHFPVCF